MGAVVAGVCRNLSFDSCNKYVMNDMTVQCECCGDETCCHLEIVTRPIELQSEAAEEIDVDLDREGIHLKNTT
jgi:hypothetical protein